jgi:S-adenosylmethionine hydrolase
MKGVIAGRAPAVPVVDVTHGIPPQDVLAGALVLRHAVPYFPPGTVHVAVVDPGVGSARGALCVETDTATLVGPDNGLLSLAAPPASVRRIVELAEERFFLAPRSATFHGRDVFAPVAAALATGTDPDDLGPRRSDLVRLTLPEPVRRGSALHGQVIYVDRFGNLVTNLPGHAFPRDAVSISIGQARIRGISPSYAAVARDTPVAVVNSWDLLEIAVRDGSARERLGVGVGEPVTVET